jgi:hypothetical protein
MLSGYKSRLNVDLIAFMGFKIMFYKVTLCSPFDSYAKY